MDKQINYPKHYTKPPTMEMQTTAREKSAYLDNAGALKKKKKKVIVPRRKKRMLRNGAVEDQNQAQEEDADARCTGSQKKSRGRRSMEEEKPHG